MTQTTCRRTAAVAALGLALLSARRAAADTVELKNGDRLTGTIASQSTDVVTLDTDFAGRVTIKRSAIARLTPAPPAATEPQDVSWHVALTAGLNGSRGNSETTSLSTSGTATRLTGRDRLGVFGTYLFSSAGAGSDAVTTARAVRGGLRYDHDAAGPLYLFGFGDGEHDLLQLLDLRTVVGGGAGVHLLKTDSTQTNLFAGVSYARDSYATGTTTDTTTTTTTSSGPPITPPGHGGTPPGLSGTHPSRGGTPPTVVRTSTMRTVAEFLVGQDFSRQLSGDVGVDESVTLFPAIGDVQDYRVAFDLSLWAQINGWLQWNVTVADRYLHIPPAGGAVQNDVFVSTGLGITFGRDTGTYTGTEIRRTPPRKR